MATGGGPSPRSDDRRQDLTCSLCLDIFTQPRLLHCAHTFCLKCLEDLASRQSSSTFPCPNCRSEVTVPAGGVSQFPKNFYIRLEDLDIAREGTRCLTHPKEELDLYCTDCQFPVCQKCVLTKHKPHNVEDLCQAARGSRAQLRQDEERLEKAVSYLTMAVEAEQREQQDLQDKKAAVKSSVSRTYDTVVALAAKCRDELLASVDTACGPMEEEVKAVLTTTTDNLQELCQLQQRLQQTLSADTATSLVTLAKEMREGKGGAQAVDSKTSAKRSAVTRPVVNSAHTLDMLTQNVRGFFGTVQAMEMKATPVEVVVEKKFTCKAESDTEVFSLCALDNGAVWVSYASCGLQNNTASDVFQESGQHTRCINNASGKCSWKSRDNGKAIMLFHPSDSSINTNSKHRGHYNHHLSLNNRLQGKATITKDKVTSEDPFKTENFKQFTINVGAHKAFDVNSSEQLFAVVEEAQAADHPRQVKLYQRGQPDAVATYTPPSTPFIPADVCFVSMGGQEVLTIADEAGDSVHVVHVQDDGRFRFLRHLAAGCPLLVQPTALNSDHRGRLWVACRGGAILTMTPVDSS